ncbi:hypothetical protein M0Q50_10495 [bacterium]|jgi:hypothetical protein|nr:hypothetical protein [bacterium]
MYYYHGSKTKFDTFDFTYSKNDIKVIHLTPHLEYAKSFAIKDNDIGYIYVVSVKGYDDIIYHEYMNNVCFASLDNIKIVEMIEVKK